ncbi:MAG: ATP synthase F1 subunit gamma [Ruminococcus sp.]|nr:ATP synthase F1 subunit gamma [Ruminococcus sp.]
MGADIKSLKTRIRSIDSTLHLTKAMGLVASSKIRKATEAMLKSKEYSDTAEKMINTLMADSSCKRSKYLRTPDGKGKKKLIVVAGDRGLAGGYNANIFRTLRSVSDTELVPIGKKACDRLGNGYISAEEFSYEQAKELADKLCSEYASGEYDEISILCTKYVSIMTQEPQILKLFPFSADENSNAVKTSMVFEPGELEILNTFIPEYIAGKIIACVRESFASEVAARRVAMDNAGKNANQMISDLQLEYNRARQSIITQEITEIVAGSGR